MTEEEIRFIAEAIRDGKCVLFTGPGIAVTEEKEGARSINQELSAKLRAKLVRPDETTEDASLAHVSQVFLMEDPTRGRFQLVSFLQNEIKQYAGRTTEIHRKLAKLPFRICLTTSMDGYLRVAFEGERKRPVCEFLDFSNGEPHIEELPDDPSTPFLYRLYGSIDRPQSLVLTEDDLINYLINVVRRGFPKNLVSIIQDPESVFLFLGFGLYHWHLRILLKVLDEANRRVNPSFAFESGLVHSQGARSMINAYAMGQARVFFKYGHKIVLGSHSLEEFVEQLSTEFAEVKEKDDDKDGRTASLSAPKVFCSYTRADSDKISGILECLSQEGFKVWQDRKDLEPGDRFEAVIQRAIDETDYFIFLESHHTEPPDVNKSANVSSWWRREVVRAVKRSEDFPFGFRFIIPIRIEDCVKPDELKCFETIDFFRDDGCARLVSTISRDWQRRRREGLNRGAAQ